MKDIIKQLKSVRIEKGLSQSELGTKLGLPQSHISKIEKGDTDLRLSTVTDMARVLDLELMLIPRQLVPFVSSVTDGAEDQGRMWQPDEAESDQ